MTIAIVSVLAIAGTAFALQRTVPALHPKRAAWFCPVCIGVSMSWLWVLVSLHSGWLTDSAWIIVAAILVGGSAAGIAERLSQDLANDRRIPAKLAIIAVGFAVAYAAIRSWTGVVIAVAALVVVALLLARRAPRTPIPPHGDRTTTDELKRKLEQCC